MGASAEQVGYTLAYRPSSLGLNMQRKDGRRLISNTCQPVEYQLNQSIIWTFYTSIYVLFTFMKEYTLAF